MAKPSGREAQDQHVCTKCGYVAVTQCLHAPAPEAVEEARVIVRDSIHTCYETQGEHCHWCDELADRIATALARAAGRMAPGG